LFDVAALLRGLELGVGVGVDAGAVLRAWTEMEGRKGGRGGRVDEVGLGNEV